MHSTTLTVEQRHVDVGRVKFVVGLVVVTVTDVVQVNTVDVGLMTFVVDSQSY